MAVNHPPTAPFDAQLSFKIDALLLEPEHDDTRRIKRSVLRLRKRWAERRVPAWMPANGRHHE